MTRNSYLYLPVGPRLVLATVLASAVLLLAFAATVRGATADTVVSATVPSATSLDASGCQTDTANVTNFGTVLPGTLNVTSAPCVITFGSSNDTSLLKLFQTAAGAPTTMSGGSSGVLDPSFGTAGSATTAIGIDANDHAATIDPANGDIITTGLANVGGQWEFAITAYAPATGVLDPGFGAAGITTTAIGTYGSADGATIDPVTGDIIVAGEATVGGTHVFAIAAYDATTGMLDPDFGTAGITTTAIGTYAAASGGATINPANGDIIVTGRAIIGGQNEYAIAAYDATTGMLDPDFGTAGFTTTAIGTTASADGLIVDPANGDLIVGGSATVGGTSTFTIAAYTAATGALDASFGTAGITSTVIGSSASGYSLTVDGTSGNIIAAGFATIGGQWEFAIAAYNPTTGLLDPSFGTAGTATTAIGTSATVKSVMTDPASGDIVAAGSAFVGGANEFAVAAYRSATGLLDPNFGSDGVITTMIGTAASGASMTVEPASGNIIVAGNATVGGQTGFAVAAYSPYGSIPVNDYTTSGNGSWGAVSGSGTDLFGVCLETVTAGAQTDASTWAAAGSGNCTTADTVGTWNAIADTSAESGAKVADSTTSGTLTATVNLHFGFRTATNQPAATYRAAITIEVDAPNV